MSGWPRTGMLLLIGLLVECYTIFRIGHLLTLHVFLGMLLLGPVILKPAAELFAQQRAADRVPSVRAIRAQLHVGQPRAQRLRDYLATGGVRRVENRVA